MEKNGESKQSPKLWALYGRPIGHNELLVTARLGSVTELVQQLLQKITAPTNRAQD